MSVETGYCIACGRGLDEEMECSICGEIQALTPGVTADMLRAVRKHDCLVYGHDWHILIGEKDRPSGVVCRRCGGSSGLKRCGCGR